MAPTIHAPADISLSSFTAAIFCLEFRTSSPLRSVSFSPLVSSTVTLFCAFWHPTTVSDLRHFFPVSLSSPNLCHGLDSVSLQLSVSLASGTQNDMSTPGPVGAPLQRVDSTPTIISEKCHPKEACVRVFDEPHPVSLDALPCPPPLSAAIYPLLFRGYAPCSLPTCSQAAEALHSPSSFQQDRPSVHPATTEVEARTTSKLTNPAGTKVTRAASSSSSSCDIL